MPPDKSKSILISSIFGLVAVIIFGLLWFFAPAQNKGKGLMWLLVAVVAVWITWYEMERTPWFLRFNLHKNLQKPQTSAEDEPFLTDKHLFIAQIILGGCFFATIVNEFYGFLDNQILASFFAFFGSFFVILFVWKRKGSHFLKEGGKTIMEIFSFWDHSLRRYFDCFSIARFLALVF